MAIISSGSDRPRQPRATPATGLPLPRRTSGAHRLLDSAAEPGEESFVPGPVPGSLGAEPLIASALWASPSPCNPEGGSQDHAKDGATAAAVLSPSREDSLRPSRLADYIGQRELKQVLGIAVEATRSRGEALDHVLLHGPPGLGKTTMALVLANELGVRCRITSAPALERPATSWACW